MKNIFIKLFCLFTFILSFATCTVADETLGITSVIYDNSSSIVTINSFDNTDFNFSSQPKLYVVQEENKAYFDINSAILKCPVQDLVLSNGDIKEIVVSQFSTNPNIVRVVISYKQGFNPANIQLKKLNNTLFVRLKNPTISNYYFQQVYEDVAKSRIFETSGVQSPVTVANSSLVGQINSAFKLGQTTDDKNYVLVKKDLLLNSKFYINNLTFKSNNVVITGFGSLTVTKPMHLSNPSRVAFDIPNAIVNPAIRNKDFKFNQTESVKIGQFDKNTARIVITSSTPSRYIPVIYGDGERLVIVDKLNVLPTGLYTSKVNLNNVLYEKNDTKTHSMKLLFSKPVVYGLERTSSAIELLLYNVDKYTEGSIKSTLKNTAFSNVKITSLSQGGVKFVVPVENEDNIDIHAGADGKTIRIKEQFNKLAELPKPKVEPVVTVPSIVVPTKKETNKHYVVIDAGHGGSDVGATRNGVYEKNITLDVSKRVANLLRKKGYIVEMTRTTDTYVSLQDRVAISEDINPDVFVSIHVNSSNSDSPTGLETHYYKDNSLELAKYVHASLLNHVNSKDRGLFKSRFYVINHTTAPAILVEIGFISSPIERAQLVSESRKQATAKAIAEGINDYFNKK